ncbi:MAG: hypothetical protein JXR70_07375 [Spirochaetales bacterium]|nr:hypothetical protein [Spirochaetales bacterium]
MIFFNLLSMPMFYFGYSSFLNDQNRESGFSFWALFKGLLWFIPSMIIYLLLHDLFSLSYVGVKHFFYIFFTDYLLFSLLAMAGYLLLLGLSAPYEKGGSVKDVVAYFSGFFLGVNIFNLVIHGNELSFFLLFVIPFIRILQVYFLSFLMDKFSEGDGFQRIVWALAMVVALLILCFVHFFYKVNMPVFFIIFSLLSLAACPLSYYFLKDL